MKISYNWLKKYINIDLDPEKLSVILTDIGLEVEGLEKWESIKGGLKGVVIGKVLTCEKHPNADKLNKTTIDIGNDQILPVVCGAPNIAAGQNVPVATVGTIIYSGDESFEIKKSKIRGEVSQGMVCSEVELNIGTNGDGILVLPNSIKPGTPADEYFDIENDHIFEIGLTPNRIDAASHYGVARDIAAYLKQKDNIDTTLPAFDNYNESNDECIVEVSVNDKDACPRYSGITIKKIKVAPSPDWLQNRLKSIGLNPINNVVDITNFVLHETGHPLHAFDLEKITDNKLNVRFANAKEKFITLDDVDRELREEDLVIANSQEPMCIAGVMGGSKSGVSNETTSIFIECAYFNPVVVRKAAKAHAINSDSSFRFERGVDPNDSLFVIKRAASLICKIANGEVSSKIVDLYPTKIDPWTVRLTYKNVDRLIGKELGKDTIKNIIAGLSMDISAETEDYLDLLIPTYRVDVTREADIIEDILRIYGYNNIEIPLKLNSTVTYEKKNHPHKIQNLVSDLLSSKGFNEMMANSLTKKSYYEANGDFNADKCVEIINPLSQDLNVMRQTLTFSGLETISVNTKFKNADLKLYEFGNVYELEESEGQRKYKEYRRLNLYLTGNNHNSHWSLGKSTTNFYQLKSYVNGILTRLGFDLTKLTIETFSNKTFAEGIKLGKYVTYGIVSKKLLKSFDVKADVYMAEFNWDAILKDINKNKVLYSPVAKFPSVERDLALVLDNNVQFEQIKTLALKVEKKLIKNVDLFDVYTGDQVPEGKKSYAVRFTMLDETKTLTDKQIDKAMSKIIYQLKNVINAELR